jgi:antitoxin ParD1/3/4
MSVKESVSISEAQDAFARGLVKQGRFASLSAVVQRGIELVRAEIELSEAETEALKALLREREAGLFETEKEARASTARMIAEKRSDLGL